MAKREAFLQAVLNGATDDFLRFIQLHKDASDPFDLNERLQEMSRKQKEALWEKLKQMLAQILVEDPIEAWQKSTEDDEDDMETQTASKKEHSIAVIQGVTTVVTTSIPIVDENINYTSLLECALILNGIIYTLPDTEKSLLRALQGLCEQWWTKGLNGKEQFGKTTFIQFLKNSLEKKTVAGADVVRLWHFHRALLCFDYDSEESNEVKDLLLRCFMSVLHIKKEEGRRLLSFVFTWNVNFIKLIHGTVKNQLQCSPRSLVTHIAEIYFRAWKKASGEILEVIEHSCIQDFMHHGIHLPRNSPLHPKVREFLSYFHKQNKCRQGVEEVLYRLYQPILWRSLKARNSEVRSNAALLFIDAFPILDPGFNREDTDNEIQRQFDELFSLLEDPQPLVRSTGVLGVCKIAFKYWEMIPATVLADLLKALIEKLAFDATSADVRCSVFKCLPIILDNVLSHPLLEQLLPALKYNLHDNSEKVRVAFVDMLLKIKSVKAAKFWKICSIDSLLIRLEMDSRPVSRRLVSLLFSSFFPTDQPEEVWCERCVTLIQMNPAAARKFYLYAYVNTSPSNIAKLMLTIQRCLNACIQQGLKTSDSGDEDSEKENMSISDNVLSIDDVPSMAGLLEVVVILWRSIRKALDRNEEGKNHIIQKFASVLPDYLKIFKDERCISPIIIMASFMTPANIPTFSCGVISKLKNLENGATENKYSPLLDCLCRWGKVSHVIELICDWMAAEPSRRESNGGGSERRVRIQETHESKPELALDYTEYLLTHYMNRNCLLSLPKEKLNQLLEVLEAAKDVLDSHIRESDARSPGFCKPTALRAFGLYCRLSIHLQYKFASDGQDCLSALEETGAWIGNSILPALLTDEEEGHSEHISETSRLVVQTYLTVCKDMIAVGLGDSEFQERILTMGGMILHGDQGCVFIPVLLGILGEMVEASLTAKNDNECLVEVLNNIQKMFQKILECMAFRLRRHREEGIQLIHSVQEPLGKFLHVVQNCSWSCPTVHHGVLSSLLAAAVVETGYILQHKASNPEELTPPKSLSDLPPLSSTLLTIMNKSVNMVKSFLNELMESIESEEIEGIISLTATVYIVALIKGKKKPSYVKDVASVLQRKLVAYSEITKEDGGSVQRTLYEIAVHTLNENFSS